MNCKSWIRQEKEKMTREEYQKHMELVKKAVKDDLTELDSRKSILKARVR